MRNWEDDSSIVSRDDRILVTGASGFVGSRVVACLLDHGFRNVRCFVRSANETVRHRLLGDGHDGGKIELLVGNLLSREDCVAATGMFRWSCIWPLAEARNSMRTPS